MNELSSQNVLKGLLLVMSAAALLVAAACAPAVPPTPTPTKAPPPPTATAAPAPKVEATKPAPPAATPTTAPAAKPIKIGYLSPMSGPVGVWGLNEKGVVLIALEDINKAGGINGYPLEMVEGDTQADPRQVVTLVRKLALEDKVFAIVGPFTSMEFDVSAPLANDLQLPVATGTAGIPGIAAKNRPWSFQFSAPETASIPAVVRGFKKAYPQVKRVVVVHDNKNLQDSLLGRDLGPKALKEAGFEVIDTVAFETGIPDMAPIVTKIKGMNPEGMAYYSQTPDALKFAKEAARQGLKVPTFSSVARGGAAEMAAAPELFEGWLIPGIFDMTTQEPRAKAFMERYVKAAEAIPGATKPAVVGTYGMTYNLMMALGEVMRKSNISPEMDLQKARIAIRDGLQGLKDFKDIGGHTITMQPDGSVAMDVEAFIGRNGRWGPLR